MKHWLVWLVAVAAIAAAFAGVWLWRERPVDVMVAKASAGLAVELVYATGFVEAQQPVSVAARLTAPVSQVLVAEGAAVHRGQPLVLLADDEQHALLDQAAAQRRAAEQTEFRMVTLFRQGWVTKAARDQAVANADVARAAQRTAAARRDQLVVRANIDGIVTKRDVEPGDLATPTRVLMLLGDPGRIRITAIVDERDIARVRTGAAAMMSSDAWPGKTIAAHVSEVTPGGDPAQRAFRVRLLPDAAGNLPLGMTLEVNIVSRKDDRAVLVPVAALADGHVWVVAAGKARQRQVRSGIDGTDKVQILSGVRPGESVIVAPPAGLKDGQAVKEAAP